MALIDKASLLMVPSTYEAGKLYNVLPSGNRAPDSTDQNSGYDQTRADFDFDRGSNTAASRINSSGLIEKYRENLLLQSEAFSASWSAFSATATTGQSGYDGTTNALLLTSTGNYARIQQAASGTGIMTASCYMKAGTTSWAMIRVAGSGYNITQYFDLENGVIGSLSGVSASINLVSDGWYRCEVVVNVLATPTFYIYTALADGNLSVTNETITIQSPQFESGLVATTFIPTTSVTGKAGVLVDLPRINYDANGENGALLLEPSRQQLITQSEYIGGSDWTYDSSSGVNNSAVSPDGKQNAALITANGANIDHTIYQLPVLSTGTYTLSAFVKKNTQRYVHLAFNQLNSSSLWSSSVFDLETLAKADYSNGTGYNDGTSKIEAYGNDWYRISLTESIPNATTIISFIGFAEDMSAPDTSRGRWSFATTNSFYVWGAQCEAGSYPSSYIPNHGESGGVTRAADSCNGGGSAESINSVEGVLYTEIAALANDGTFRQIDLSYGTANTNYVRLEFATTSNLIYGVIKNNTQQAALSFVLSDSTNLNKIAIKYKVNDFALWVNGVEVDTDTSGSVPIGLSEFNFNSGTGSNSFYGNVKQVAVFNEALTDSELATLTTL